MHSGPLDGPLKCIVGTIHKVGTVHFMLVTTQLIVLTFGIGYHLADTSGFARRSMKPVLVQIIFIDMIPTL